MNKKIKILFILPSFGVGGAEKNTLNLSNYYISKGYIVGVLVFTDDIELRKKLNPSIDFFQINSHRLRGGVWKAAKIIYKYKPNIIYANMWPITLISQFAKLISFSNANLIMVEHINLSSGLVLSSLFERFLAKLTHLFFRLVGTKFVAVSSGVKRDLISNYKLKENQIKIIYNPVIENAPSLVNVSKYAIKKNSTSAINILSVGNLKKQKNYKNLINSVNILVNRGYKINCMIIGDGGERNELVELVGQLNLNNSIKFLGRLIDIEKYYILTDVFVLSSSYEGLGNVLIEALSFGCRIVSTDCDYGPREILEDGKYGVLVEKDNPLELANGIEKSLSIELNQIKLRDKSLDFLVDIISEQYLKA